MLVVTNTFWCVEFPQHGKLVDGDWLVTWVKHTHRNFSFVGSNQHASNNCSSLPVNPSCRLHHGTGLEACSSSCALVVHFGRYHHLPAGWYYSCCSSNYFAVNPLPFGVADTNQFISKYKLVVSEINHSVMFSQQVHTNDAAFAHVTQPEVVFQELALHVYRQCHNTVCWHFLCRY